MKKIIRNQNYLVTQQQLQEERLKKLMDQKENSFFLEFEMLERIGAGHHSNVFRGKQRRTNKEVAIKVIQILKLTPDEMQRVKRQCGILTQCFHPIIIKFIANLQTKTHFYIVTEILSEENLFQYTKKNHFLEEFEAAIIFQQLVQTILYLNNQLGVICRNIQPNKVMIMMKDDRKMVKRIKLIDFRLAVYKEEISNLSQKEKFVGIPGFTAPEIYQEEQYDEKIDTFGLGIILYFMLCGQLPFQSSFVQQIEYLVKSCSFSLKNKHWANVSLQAKDLIQNILTFKQKRITTQQVFDHPWLQNLEKLKQYNGKNNKNKII